MYIGWDAALDAPEMEYTGIYESIPVMAENERGRDPLVAPPVNTGGRTPAKYRNIAELKY